MARSKAAQIVVAQLRKLRDQQRNLWNESNAGLPGVVPKALGLIHARAAWDVNYAKRLVFNHFQLEGMASSDSDHKEILEMVKLCLQSFAEELFVSTGLGSTAWIKSVVTGSMAIVRSMGIVGSQKNSYR